MEPPWWLDRQAWPWPPRWVELPEGFIHYVDEGTGPAVVLVHGTPTWGFEWRHVIAGLTGRCRTIALDHLGFGLSERPAAAGYRPEDHARRFAAWVEQVVPAGRLHLVVHDFGGPIALDWALRDPDRLHSLTVLNSWMWSFEDDRAMRRSARLVGSAVGRFLYRRFNASQRFIMPSAYGDRRKLTPDIHRQYLALFPDAESRERVFFTLAQSLLGSSAFFDTLWQCRDRLARVPLELIWGMRDSAFPPYILNRWQQAMPHAHTTALAGAGHWPHEEEPAAVVEALRQVIARS
jgi:haloalkane dehalogenase